MSVIPAPPWEITSSRRPTGLRPIIRWGDRIVPNEDMRQIQYLPGRNGRGFGPLQKLGAAVSVAVESEQWAANFFSGSLPSVIGTTDQDMTGDELDAMDQQWMEKPPSLPRWLTNGLTMSDAPFDPEKAQLRDVRDANVGDAARMFNIPGALIEYQMPGSSLTYRNDETIWTDFQRRCLSPHYLEPMEQEMSDLLTRSTVARFNLDQLLRASAKERAEINAINIASGIYTAEYAAMREGITPGGVDFAPTLPALPQAVPTSLPGDSPATLAPPPLFALGRAAMVDLKCPKCGRIAGRVVRTLRRSCASGAATMVGGGMSWNDLVMTRGDTRTLTLTLTDSDAVPFDLTGATLRFTVGDLLEKATGDGIVVADPDSGVAVITINPADTEDASDWRRSYPYDIQVTFLDGTVITPILGRFVLRPDVTQPE